MINLHVDASGIERVANLMKAAGKGSGLALIRAVNHTGDKARTQVRIALVPQTGLKRRTIDKAVKSKRAFNGGAYEIISRGGNVRVMFFSPRETRKGVSAAPWNARRVYPGSFMKGGRFPNRKALGIGVVQRVGKSRTPLQTVKSGLFIPEEMVKGQSAAVFFATVEQHLPERLAHELYRILA